MSNIETLIKALPKAEQHVHIIGSIRPETLLRFIEEGDVEQPFETVDEVRRFFRFRDFPHFISVYSTVLGCITKENQFEPITYELLENEAHSKVCYVEASFSALDHVRRGLDYGLMLDGINRGISRARNDFGIECSVRVDLVRNYGPETGMKVLDWIQNKNDNIVSVDLGGSEEQFPPKPYAPVFHRAKTMGLHLVAHAGEAAGPESVWTAVKELGVEHVGHGVSAWCDSDLMTFLSSKRIVVETCPISNLKTGVVPSLQAHPIRRFIDTGICVTVNTDDPSMFGTGMNNEYLQLHRNLGFTVPELFKLSLNAIDSSFLSDARKNRLRESFVKEYERLCAQYL